MNSLEKDVENYKEKLKMKYWSLSEISYFLQESDPEFWMKGNLFSPATAWIGRENYGMIAGVKKRSNEIDLFLASIVKKIKDGNICFELVSSSGIGFFGLNDIMYFLMPREVLALAVTEGFYLPRALQIAANLRQAPPVSMKLGILNNIKKRTIAHVLWWYFPKESISGICRKMTKLQKRLQFSYINTSMTRLREVVVSLRPKQDPQPMLPELIQQVNELSLVDFQALKIVVCTIADLILLRKETVTEKDILDHPLISCYFSIGKEEIREIINFSLQEAFKHIFDLSQEPATI